MGGKSLARSKVRPKRSLRIVDKKPIGAAGRDGAESPAVRLVLTATRLFNETSIHSTGIDRIIEEAGVARRTLYNQFGSKEGLIRAVMQRESNAWFEWLDSELTPSEIRDPRQRITRFFALLGKWFSRSDFKAAPLSTRWASIPWITACGRSRRPIVKPTSSTSAGFLLGVKYQISTRPQIKSPSWQIGATVTAMVTGNHMTAETAAHAALAVMDVAERRSDTAQSIQITA